MNRKCSFSSYFLNWWLSYLTVRPACVQLSEGQQLCVVCHDVANGIHFGAITCEGCKVSNTIFAVAWLVAEAVVKHVELSHNDAH